MWFRSFRDELSLHADHFRPAQECQHGNLRKIRAKLHCVLTLVRSTCKRLERQKSAAEENGETHRHPRGRAESLKGGPAPCPGSFAENTAHTLANDELTTRARLRIDLHALFGPVFPRSVRASTHRTKGAGVP